MMGFETPGDQRVQIPKAMWSAWKLALWRNKVWWEYAMRAAIEIVDRCKHADGCPGAESETEPCLQDRYDLDGALISRGCPDREQRMSAFVILNAARMGAPEDARRPANEPYSAPTREFFSEVMAELAATQAELEALRAIVDKAGLAPLPPPLPPDMNSLPA
jgi:hypothetical protein